MEIKAILKDAPLSAQKCRLVADMVRRAEVSTAVNILKFTPKKGAELVLKLLESAISNAENTYAADIDELIVSQIFVDEATTLKRMMPRAKGRGNRISKRRCHITIKVSDEV